MKKLAPLCLLIALLYSCEIINPAEEVPAFIEVDEVNLDINVLQGGNTSDINQLLVFLDGNNIGGYPIPARIPIYGDGEQSVTLAAAVKQNAQSSTALIYPFYSQVTVTDEFIPGENRRVEMNISYRDNAVFAFVEDFEFGNQFVVDQDENPATSIIVSNEESASGANSGLITLTRENPDISVATDPLIEGIPLDGSGIYLEMDYRNEAAFSVGLVGVEDGEEFSQELLLLNTSDEWKKAYVRLTDLILDSGFENYRVLIRARHNSTVGESSRIFLDNFKLIHF